MGSVDHMRVEESGTGIRLGGNQITEKHQREREYSQDGGRWNWRPDAPYPAAPNETTGWFESRHGRARALGPQPAGRPPLMPRLRPRTLSSNMVAAAAARDYRCMMVLVPGASLLYCSAVWTAIDKR